VPQFHISTTKLYTAIVCPRVSSTLLTGHAATSKTTKHTVVWPTTTRSADWSTCSHVTFSIIEWWWSHMQHGRRETGGGKKGKLPRAPRCQRGPMLPWGWGSLLGALWVSIVPPGPKLALNKPDMQQKIMVRSRKWLATELQLTQQC